MRRVPLSLVLLLPLAGCSAGYVEADRPWGQMGSLTSPVSIEETHAVMLRVASELGWTLAPNETVAASEMSAPTPVGAADYTFTVEAPGLPGRWSETFSIAITKSERGAILTLYDHRQLVYGTGGEPATVFLRSVAEALGIPRHSGLRSV